MPSRVLVTGANGFLGFHLSRLLVDEGNECHLFALRGTPTHWLEPLIARGARLFEGDILEPATLEPAMADVDLVFHTAGSTEEWAPDPRRILQVNVEGTRNVCRATLHATVTRVVFTSSAAAAGSAPPGGLATEDVLWDLWETGPYTVSKLLAEKEVFQWGARGLDVVALLPHQMVGDHDFRPSTPGGLILRFLRGHLPVAVDAATQILDGAAADRDLGFRPGDWRPAVKRAVEWFRENTLLRSASPK